MRSLSTTFWQTNFIKLNHDWNAEPNAPHPLVHVDAAAVILEFYANPWQFPRFADGQRLRLIFTKARRYRLGPTNDEGWYMGHCRFSNLAPAWGEFYEVTGDAKLADIDDWCLVRPEQPSVRHFLFYLRDETFECEADAWHFES